MGVKTGKRVRNLRRKRTVGNRIGPKKKPPGGGGGAQLRGPGGRSHLAGVCVIPGLALGCPHPVPGHASCWFSATEKHPHSGPDPEPPLTSAQGTCAECHLRGTPAAESRGPWVALAAACLALVEGSCATISWSAVQGRPNRSEGHALSLCAHRGSHTVTCGTQPDTAHAPMALRAAERRR